MEAAWMAQMQPRGYRTWSCECGRHTLALALDACPDCEKPQPAAGQPAPSAPAPAPEPAAQPAGRAPSRRTRTRTPRGGSNG